MNPTVPNLEDDKHFLKWAIAFYEAIPDERWCCGHYVRWFGPMEQNCSLGHLGVRASEEIQLGFLGAEDGNAVAAKLCIVTDQEIAAINDGKRAEYPQPTPKARVLAFLQDLLAKKIGL